MRIFVFSDWHGGFDELNEPEERRWRMMSELLADPPAVLINAGDHSNWGETPAEFYVMMKEVAASGTKLLHVFGNHENGPARAEFAMRLPESSDLTGKAHIAEGVMYYGFDVEGYLYNDNGPFRPQEDLIDLVTKEFARCRPPMRIFVSHEAALAYRSKKKHPVPVGHHYIQDILEATQPDFHICGHYHEPGNEPYFQKAGRSIIVNPGPYGCFLEQDKNEGVRNQCSTTL